MMMKPSPASTLEMTEPDLLLEVLVVALDSPAELGDLDHLLERCRGRQGVQRVLGRFGLARRPFDQQPLLRVRFASPIVAMGGANADSGKARSEPSGLAFPPGEGLEGPRRQPQVQSFQVYRRLS